MILELGLQHLQQKQIKRQQLNTGTLNGDLHTGISQPRGGATV